MDTEKNVINLTAPIIDGYIDRYSSNSWNSPKLTAESLDALAELFVELRQFTPNGRNDTRVLYISAERGPIEDFGDYDDMLAEEIVKDRDEYHKLWLEYYPNEVKWYNLTAIEDVPYGYQCVYLGERFFISRSKDTKATPYGNDFVELLHWLTRKVRECAGELRQKTYNNRRALEVPKSLFTGIISRKDFWDISPKIRKDYLAEFSKQDIDEFLQWAASPEADEKNEPKDTIRMTAGLFYQCCAWGYEANHYEGCGKLSPRKLYDKYADGRDEGLGKIDENSPDAFDYWYKHPDYGGHPWEVCRGGNSTHVSLYVCEGKTSGYYFCVAGKSFGRSAEAIKFFLALRRHGMPVILSDARGLAARITETDVIGIVPEGVLPVYCESCFPRNDILDFMNLPFENKSCRAKIIAKAQWYPLEQARLNDADGESR